MSPRGESHFETASTFKELCFNRLGDGFGAAASTLQINGSYRRFWPLQGRRLDQTSQTAEPRIVDAIESKATAGILNGDKDARLGGKRRGNTLGSEERFTVDTFRIGGACPVTESTQEDNTIGIGRHGTYNRCL